MSKLHSAQLTSFILFIAILFSNPALAQTSSSDKARLINDTIIRQLNAGAADTAQMRQLLTKIRKCRRKLGDHYQPLLKHYIRLADEHEYSYGLMKSLDYLGLQKRYDEHYDEALSLHQQSLAIALALNDTLQMCYNYSNLAQAYRKQDLNALALPYFHKALALQEQLGNTKSASYTHNTLGATYLSQNEFPKAFYHLAASNKTAEERNDIRTMSFNYGMMGEIHLLQNQPDSALIYFLKALEIKEKLNYDKGIAVTYHLMGQAYYLLNNYPESIGLFNKAIEIHQRYKNQRYLALCYAYLGKINLDQKQFAKAHSNLDLALNMANNVHSIEQLILTNAALTNLYKAENNWEKAYEHLAQTNNWKDSLNTAKYHKEIQSLEVNYQTKKKEQQIEILSAANQIKNQRIRLGIAVIIILVLSIAFGIYILFQRKKNAHQKEEKLRQQLLKSQMNPHFIFNALGSIQNYMYKNDADSAARYMGNFAKLTRSILNNSSNDQVTLDEEIDTLRNYLELEQMRTNSSFKYELKYNDDLETELINIPPMLLQPFAENAIKHGIKDMNSGGLISINFKEENKLICAEITDNGVGINSSGALNSNHKSLATKIFKQRIAILKSNYTSLPEPVIKDISTNKQSGTLVRVYLPILN